MVMCECGEVSDGKLELNDAGQTSDDEWHRIPERYGHVILDTYQVMLNHLHGILQIIFLEKGGRKTSIPGL